MKDWKLLAKALGLDISDQEIDRLKPALDSLEAAFRPLTASIPGDVEPALIFRCVPEEKE
jgi:hypothetical protein